MKSEKQHILKQIIPAIFAVAIHFLTYYLPKCLYHGSYVTISTALDRAIPFYPLFVVFYVGAYVQWGMYWLRLAIDKTDRRYGYISSEALSKLICAVTFLLLPITMTRPQITGTDLFSRALAVIYRSDTPVCLFPSIHCLQSWFCFRYNLESSRPKWFKVFSALFSLGVFASTVLVKQHLAADILGGIVLAELSLRVFRRTSLPKRFAAQMDRLFSR